MAPGLLAASGVTLGRRGELAAETSCTKLPGSGRCTRAGLEAESAGACSRGDATARTTAVRNGLETQRSVRHGRVDKLAEEVG